MSLVVFCLSFLGTTTFDTSMSRVVIIITPFCPWQAQTARRGPCNAPWPRMQTKHQHRRDNSVRTSLSYAQACVRCGRYNSCHCASASANPALLGLNLCHNYGNFHLACSPPPSPNISFSVFSAFRSSFSFFILSNSDASFCSFLFWSASISKPGIFS